MKAMLRAGLVIVFAATALAQQRNRPVRTTPTPPAMPLDCKPETLSAPDAERCRTTRLAEGRRLFDDETFGGNGRTCATCHSKETGTFSPADAQARLAANPLDPLFLHDGLDNGASGTSTITDRATIRVTLPLPSHLSLKGDPNTRQVTFRRATPTTKNTPSLDKMLMSDLRAPTLEAQADGAIHGHAQSTVEPTKLQLELIAEFERADVRFFSDERLLDSARTGVPLLLPLGNTESEKRGRTFFEEIGPAGNSLAGACAVCHSGPMLNETNRFSRIISAPKGSRIQNVLVSERNKLNLPVYKFEIHDGTKITEVETPDIGILMTDLTSQPLASERAAYGSKMPLGFFANMFKIPSLWGVKNTAPYFHDNSAKNLDEVLEHYNFFFEAIGLPPNSLSPGDIEDIKAFLNLL